MFTLEIIGYLYLGGMGGAALALTCGLDLLSQKRANCNNLAMDRWERLLDSRFYAYALLAVCVVLGFGVLLLIADLGQPQRFLYVLTHPTFSVLTFGSYALFLSIIVAVALMSVALFGLYQVSSRVVTLIEWVGVLGGIATTFYTGFFLVQFDFIQLWANPWIPFLFAFSALSSAVGLLLFVVLLLGKDTHEALCVFFRLDRIAIILELLSVAGYFAYGGATHFRAYIDSPFFQGEWAALFWLGCIGVGMILPLLLESAYKNTHSSLLLGFTAFCLLLGGFVMRWCMITLPYFGL